MHAVFHSDPPHPIIQPEPTINPIIPSEISENNDINYTQASNQDELLSAFNSLSNLLSETSNVTRYKILIYSISYINENMFTFFIGSHLARSVGSIIENETIGNRRKEIDTQIYLMIHRCFLAFSQMIINNNQEALSFESSIIRSNLKKSICLLRSIHISIRLTQWVSNSNRNAQTLQIILSSLRKIPISSIPHLLATEISRCLIITAFLFQTLSSSDLYSIRSDLIICISKLLIDQPNSFANSSTIECLNYLNNNDIDYKKSNVDSTNSFFSNENKAKHLLSTTSSKEIVAFPAIDALRIPEKVPIISILQQIRITLFSVNIFDLNNLLDIATISLSSQSAIISSHPEIINLESDNKVFFGRCLSIDTTSKFIKFDKTPKNIVELASFIRSRRIKKSGHLNALTKDIDKIISAVYMSVKRLPRISVDFQTQISAAKILSFFISHATHSKLIKFDAFKHNVSLTPPSKLFSSFISSLSGNEDSKSVSKKIQKILFKENFISLLPSPFTFISEMIADSQVASPLFPHFINSGTFSSSCTPQSLLLLSSFEELAKSLSLHPVDFISVLLNTRATPGRVKLLTVAMKNVISCHKKNESKKIEKRIKNESKKTKKIENNDNDNFNNDDIDSDDSDDQSEEEDFEYTFNDDAESIIKHINDSLFVDFETVEAWKRMIKTNLNEVCQFGLSILKIPSEITCKIAADFYVTLVTFMSLFLKPNENSEKAKKNPAYYENDSHFAFSYDNLYVVLFIPISMLINISSALFQIEPLTNPRNALFFLGFLERIVSPSENPDLFLSSTSFSTRDNFEGDQKSSENSTKQKSILKVTSKVNATAIIKSFIVLNGTMPFWDSLFNLMNFPISAINGSLAARSMRIFAAISDFGNTLQPCLSISQRLVIDVLHNSIITRIIDMLNKMTIENFSNVSPHERCLVSLALSQLLLAWCEPIPLAAFVSNLVSPNLINMIEKLSFSISDSIKDNKVTIRRAGGSEDQVMTVKQKQSLIFENSVLEILEKVKECFEFASKQNCENDLCIAQQSIPHENITQKLSGLFFMVLESVINSSTENE